MRHNINKLNEYFSRGTDNYQIAQHKIFEQLRGISSNLKTKSNKAQLQDIKIKWKIELSRTYVGFKHVLSITDISGDQLYVPGVLCQFINNNWSSFNLLDRFSCF